MRTVTCALLAAGMSFAAAESRGSDPAVALVFADSATSPSAEVRGWDGLSWSDLGGGSFGSDPAWQALRYGANNNELALVCLNEAGELRVQVRVGGAWTAVSTLSSDCGTYSTRPFAAEYERSSGSLLVAYRKANGSAIYYRTVTGGVVSAEGSYSGLGLSEAPRWLHLASRPRSDEMVLLAATGTGLSAAVWNGSSFGNPITLSSALGSDRRAFSAAYMTGSGRALAAWGEAGGAVRYRVWDGSSWSASAAAPSIGQAAWWLTLAADVRSGSDQIVLACSDDGDDGEAMVWDGSSFGSALRVEETLGSATGRLIDAAFARDGTAVVAWRRSGEERLRYRVWDGSAWLAEGAGPVLPEPPRLVALATGAGENDVFAAVSHSEDWLPYQEYAVYAESGSVNTGSATVNGLVGANVPGVDLPDPPAGAGGGAAVNIGNNGSRTLSPGSHGALSMGNSAKLYLSAGTYVFSSYNGNNNTVQVIADTSGGDVHVVIASGNFKVNNNLTVEKSGGGKVKLHVKNGNVTAKNNSRVTADIYVYNGSIDMENDSYVYGRLFASGNIVVTSGEVGTGDPPVRMGLSAMSWAGGSAGAAAQVASELPNGPRTEPFGLASPVMRAVRITRWQEVEPN